LGWGGVHSAAPLYLLIALLRLLIRPWVAASNSNFVFPALEEMDEKVFEDEPKASHDATITVY
jgi:hypothetical protein